MDKKLFRDLIASVKEASRIARGEVKAKRIHVYSSARVKQMRQAFNKDSDRMKGPDGKPVNAPASSDINGSIEVVYTCSAEGEWSVKSVKSSMTIKKYLESDELLKARYRRKGARLRQPTTLLHIRKRSLIMR